jgi:NADH-quinone oxidoreductase subunit G
VDICPVGALLDKDFLFKQRVWLLKQAASISPVDSGGENIYLEHNEGKVWRIKPRYNPEVNTWWISDDTRYSYKVINDEKRLTTPRKAQYGAQIDTTYSSALEAAKAGLVDLVKANGQGCIYAMMSPMMAIEEAWLFGRAIRELDPEAVLVLGPVPTTGQNEVFKHSISGKKTFEIQAEKVPNAAGIRRVLALLGGPQLPFDELVKPKSTNPVVTKLKGGWIVGGYLSEWVGSATFPRGFKVIQDILPNKVVDSADVVLPAASWAEKDGSWENHAGKIQPFTAAVPPLEGTRREGDVYLNLLSRREMYSADAIRKEMGEPFSAVTVEGPKVEESAFAFAEL